MKLPRNIGGAELAGLLGKLGYEIARQTGSHIRLTAIVNGVQVHVTVPSHSPIKVGTLAGILSEVSDQQGITRNELAERLFG